MANQNIEDEYESSSKQKQYKKKEKPKKGIEEVFDLTAWEDVNKRNSRRENKKKDKDKYYDDYDNWN